MDKFIRVFRIKLMLLGMTAFFLVAGVMHFFLYFITKDIISDNIELNALSTATAIAGGIMEDVDSYTRFLETRDVDSGYYRRMQGYFASVKSSNSTIKFIYTERRIDDETVEFLLDAEPVGSADYSAPGDTTFMDEAGRAVYASGVPAILPLTVHPEYGTLLGGCAPIFGKDGEMLGLVGVNVDISSMLAYLNRFQITMLGLHTIILSAGLALFNKYSIRLMEPVVKDKLTGAYAKRYHEPLMRHQIRNAVKRGAGLALLLIDLDHFKNVNDTYGHEFGDLVLAATSKTIMECLRAGDCFIRYGGEEFVILVPAVDSGKAVRIAERIRASVEKSTVFNEAANLAVRTTISIGVSHMDGKPAAGHRGSGGRLMEMADKALYDAKVTRNAVAFFREEAAGPVIQDAS